MELKSSYSFRNIYKRKKIILQRLRTNVASLPSTPARLGPIEIPLAWANRTITGLKQFPDGPKSDGPRRLWLVHGTCIINKICESHTQESESDSSQIFRLLFSVLFRSIGSISGVERSCRSPSCRDEETRSIGQGANKWHLDLAGALWNIHQLAA